MLQNAPLLAIVAVDTDENEPSKVRQLDNWVRHFIGLAEAVAAAAEPAGGGLLLVTDAAVVARR